MGDKAKNAVKLKKYGNSMQHITTRITICIKKFPFLGHPTCRDKIHIFKEDIIITCQLVVMYMLLIQMTSVSILPVIKGHEKLSFPFIILYIEREKHRSMISGSFQWTDGQAVAKCMNKRHCSFTNATFTCYIL